MASEHSKLSVVIPAYNEEATITAVLARVYAVSLRIAREVIVVNDGSTDGTRGCVEAVRHDYPGLVVLDMPRNSGKGAAIARGVSAASGDIVVIQDADLEVDPAEHARLPGPILDDGAPVVYGSRFLGRRQQLAVNALANRVLTLLTNVLYGARISDMETAYKMVRREVFDRLILECHRFDFEPEIAAKLLRCGYPSVEVPISYAPVEAGRQEDQVAGRRSSLCGVLFRYRWAPMRRIVRSQESGDRRREVGGRR